MSLWWAFGGLLVWVWLQSTRVAMRQSMIAEIQKFLATTFVVIESEAGDLKGYQVNFREPHLSVNYYTDDGITILAGVGQRRTYLQVGAMSSGEEPQWNFDATGPLESITPQRLTDLVARCRECRAESKSCFLVYWPPQGLFLESGQDYAYFDKAGKKAFDRLCKAQSRSYL